MYYIDLQHQYYVTCSTSLCSVELWSTETAPPLSTAILIFGTSKQSWHESDSSQPEVFYAHFYFVAILPGYSQVIFALFPVTLAAVSQVYGWQQNSWTLTPVANNGNNIRLQTFFLSFLFFQRHRWQNGEPVNCEYLREFSKRPYLGESDSWKKPEV
jgi:hypothetical protein